MTDEAIKLQRFKRAVSAETDAQAAQILAQAKAESEEILSRARITASENERVMRERIENEAEMKLTRELSAARLEAQRAVLVRRSELAELVFADVEKQLAEFRKTADYTEWLADTLKSCLRKYPDRKPVVRLSPEDMPAASKLGITAQEDKSIVFGGMIVGFEGVSVALDCTFDAMLEAERAAFCNNKELSSAKD